jgi:hypothetical protein
MWNSFRRKPAEEPYPKPQWPPIQETDNIDITGKRHDGGVDLIIVTSLTRRQVSRQRRGRWQSQGLGALGNQGLSMTRTNLLVFRVSRSLQATTPASLYISAA